MSDEDETAQKDDIVPDTGDEDKGTKEADVEETEIGHDTVEASHETVIEVTVSTADGEGEEADEKPLDDDENRIPAQTDDDPQSRDTFQDEPMDPESTDLPSAVEPEAVETSKDASEESATGENVVEEKTENELTVAVEGEQDGEAKEDLRKETAEGNEENLNADQREVAAESEEAEAKQEEEGQEGVETVIKEDTEATGEEPKPLNEGETAEGEVEQMTVDETKETEAKSVEGEDGEHKEQTEAQGQVTDELYIEEAKDDDGVAETAMGADESGDAESMAQASGSKQPLLQLAIEDESLIRLEPSETMESDEEKEDQGEEEEEQGEKEEEEEEELSEAETKRGREELIEKYHQALSERHQLQETNHQLQHRLYEVFRHRRPDEMRPDDHSSTDQEKRYLNYVARLDGLHRQETEQSGIRSAYLEDLTARSVEKDEEVDVQRMRLAEFKKLIAVSSVNSHSGQIMPAQEVEQYLAADSRKEAEMVAVRLENIKLKNSLRKQEAQLKSKEELGDGLHLIDFEQLKIENQTYNEKIEERNEELQKLRRKITNTVQVLTHLKEKLQFVYGENELQKDRLQEIEQHVAKKRDALSRTKQVRDGLRQENVSLQQNAGLLGHKLLLRDFEQRYDERQELSARLSQLTMSHAEMTLNLDGLRQKIEATKAL